MFRALPPVRFRVVVEPTNRGSGPAVAEVWIKTIE